MSVSDIKPRWVWTDERVSTLKKLWTEGVSAAQIARRFGIDGPTRNAVIGKVHRLGIQRAGASAPGVRSKPATIRGTPASRITLSISGKMGGKKSGQNPKSRPNLNWTPERKREPFVPPLRVATELKGLLDLQHGDCRFPMGDKDGAEQLFCAAPAETGKSYCPHCKAIAWQPLTESDKKRKQRRLDWIVGKAA